MSDGLTEMPIEDILLLSDQNLIVRRNNSDETIMAHNFVVL